MKAQLAGAVLIVSFGAVALGTAFAGSAREVVVQAATDPSQPAFFVENVQPIFQANCYRCHAGGNHRGGLNMDSRKSLLKGGNHGTAIVPARPDQSLLLKLIKHQGPADDPMNMPPAPKPKLSDTDIAVVEAWIRAGAQMPSSDSKLRSK